LAAFNVSRTFSQMMTACHGHHLEKWITAMLAGSGQRELRYFITGILRDQAAVTSGFTVRWSSGAVEGHVNRIILWNLIVKRFISVAGLAWSAPGDGSRLLQQPFQRGADSGYPGEAADGEQDFQVSL